MAEKTGDTRLNIKSWSEEDRPREKLLIKGKEALSNAELLAILLGSGTRKLTAVEVAKRLLAEVDNDLNRLSMLSVPELCKQPGIGEAKSITIIAAAELGRRRKKASLHNTPIRSSNDAYQYLYASLSDLDHERFYVLLLNRANKIIKQEHIGTGGVSGTVVDIKILFKKTLQTEIACGLILAHNHPSGNLKPSQADMKITSKIFEAAQLFDISVLDHIIVGRDEYLSFADEGLMPTS